MNKSPSDSRSESKSDKRRGFTSEVIRTVNDAIARGDFPTKLLSEKTFEDFLKDDAKIPVTRMQVRRVIAHLEAEGILDVEPQKGTSIRVPKEPELNDIWQTRVALEEFILTQLALKRRMDLTKIREVRGKMLNAVEAAGLREDGSASREVQYDFIKLDQDFHAQIAHSAGHPHIAETLESLRLKLHIAAPLGPSFTKKRMIAIINEHDEILNALAPDQSSDWIRPNTHLARHALLVHLRNSAIYGWRIADRIKPGYVSESYNQSSVFDVPDLPSKETGLDKLPIGQLFEMRLSIELCAVWELATRPSPSISIAESLNNDLRQIVTATEMEVTRADKAIFRNLDLGFHSALCFSAGLLFAEEVIGYAWHRLHDLGRYGLDHDGMALVVEEHDAILRTIKACSGGFASIASALAAAQDHLVSAFLRHNFDEVMVEQVIKETERRLEQLRKAATSRDSLKGIHDQGSLGNHLFLANHH